jgi:hypothetical protein
MADPVPRSSDPDLNVQVGRGPLARRLRTVALALMVGACGGPERPPEAPEQPRTSEPREAEDVAAPPPTADLRALGVDATYETLLDAARRLDDRRDQESSAGCLLRGPAWRLEADLAVAVRPLPAAPSDLDALLEREPGPVNVLTRWAAHGPGDLQRPTFVAVTTALPARDQPVAVWAITDRGVYVRSTGGATGALEAQPVRALTPPEGVGALYVTAEAGTPLARVAEVLDAVPASLHGVVGLAVALTPGTRLPATAQDADVVATTGLCPEGLPPMPEDVPAGDLRPDVLVQSLGPLRQAVATCVSSARNLGPTGGRLVLSMRIGPDGRVLEACASRDEAQDPALRQCVLRVARAVAFPPPHPAGAVDVALPLVLAPEASQRQAPLCR